MVKVDFKKYNKLTKIDTIVKNSLAMIGNKTGLIFFPDPKEQNLYLMNTITLICMTKEYNLYYQIEDKELDDLYEEIKNIDYKNTALLQSIVIQNIKTIDKILKKYYLPRNYIYPRYCNELMINKTSGKSILLKNPFYINNHMEYFCDNRIQKEEKIINTIIECYLKAQKITGNKECTYRNLKITKEIIKKSIKECKLEQYVLFIVSNTYQELMENPTDQAYNDIKYIVENERIKKDMLVNYFLMNDHFSNLILNRFLSYNQNIQQGRLEELKTKLSYQYSKRIY